MNFNKFRSFPATFYTTFGFGNPQKKLERVDWEKYIWTALAKAATMTQLWRSGR